MLDAGNVGVGVTLLLVKHAELLEKVDLGSRSRLDRVEPLQAGHEAERVRLKLKGHLPSLGRDDFANAILFGLGRNRLDIRHGVLELFGGRVVRWT